MSPEANEWCSADRLCTLTGRQEAINLTKSLIEGIINQKGSVNGSSSMPRMMGLQKMGGMSGPPGGGGGVLEILVPSSKVGLVIGKGGEEFV